jgi:hypothetical protein
MQNVKKKIKIRKETVQKQKESREDHDGISVSAEVCCRISVNRFNCKTTRPLSFFSLKPSAARAGMRFGGGFRHAARSVRILESTNKKRLKTKHVSASPVLDQVVVNCDDTVYVTNFLLLSNISSIHSQVNHARSQKLLVCP